MVLALVTRVHKAVFALVMEFTQHGHGGEFGPTQRRELVVFLSSQGEEVVATIHQLAGDETVGIDDLVVGADFFR